MRKSPSPSFMITCTPSRIISVTWFNCNFCSLAKQKTNYSSDTSLKPKSYSQSSSTSEPCQVSAISIIVTFPIANFNFLRNLAFNIGAFQKRGNSKKFLKSETFTIHHSTSTRTMTCKPSFAPWTKSGSIHLMTKWKTNEEACPPKSTLLKFTESKTMGTPSEYTRSSIPTNTRSKSSFCGIRWRRP